MTELHVWRDARDSYEHVGVIARMRGGVRFGYDSSYAGPPISVNLPVQEALFSEKDTRMFFSALSPEGPLRADFLRKLRSDQGDYEALLEALNDESTGALVFSTDGSVPGCNSAYQPIDDSFFDSFGMAPQQTAFETLEHTRLSLSGAMSKVGLYQEPGTGKWFLPLGAAPSTHIVKSGSATFPLEVLNEALCLEIAKQCGFDVPASFVIEPDCGERLLVVERYDRPVLDGCRSICGYPAPARLHQEDFCQVCALPSSMKYEPTDGGYLGMLSSMASRYCFNGFGESQLLVAYVLFDYLIGNCDNHLKNFSMLYSPDWRTLSIAPMYDIVSTVLYRKLYTEMGVSFGGSRSIFGVRRHDVEDALSAAKVSVRLGMAEFDDLAEALPTAIAKAADVLSAQGFGQVDRLTELMLDGVEKRRSFHFGPDDALTLD